MTASTPPPVPLGNRPGIGSAAPCFAVIDCGVMVGIADVTRDLASSALFRLLSAAQISEIARVVTIEERDRDHEVLSEGNTTAPLYVVKDGRVGGFVLDQKYKLSILSEELGPGDPFDLVSLASGKPVEAMFATMTRSILYRLERQDFNAAVQRAPGLIAGVGRALAERMSKQRTQRQVPFVSLAGKQMDRRLWALGPENVFMQHRIVPVALSGKTLTIAMVDPEDVGAIKELREVMAGFTFKLVAVSAADLQRYIAAGFGKKRSHRGAVVDAKERPAVSFMDDEAAVQMQTEAVTGHIVNLANELVGTALALNASDIHIEVEGKGLVVRYRVDGQLRARPDPLPIEQARPLASRFKLLAKMDITESRRPMDGRISVNVGKRIIDLRISTMPAKLGEKIVIRLLDAAANISSIKNIITVDAVRDVFGEMLSRPHGLILVTGPTGSGKTTTLYTALSERRRPELNMVTVEDPIEYHLEGVTQVQTHAEIGTTFEVLLRSILRQDPDVIMVGETRDRETARIAVEASMTGHLVLTSVHTNSAIDAIMRLIDLGVERYSIATGLMGVVHQRLVRRLCASCKEPFEYPQPIIDRLYQCGALQEGDKTVLLHGAGCQVCNGTGFKGRIALYELLNVNEYLKHSIATGMDPAGLREVAVSRDALFDLARYSGVLLARGDTAPTEVLHISEQGVSSDEAFSGGERAPRAWVGGPAAGPRVPGVAGGPLAPGVTAHFGGHPGAVPAVSGAPLGPALTANFGAQPGVVSPVPGSPLHPAATASFGAQPGAVPAVTGAPLGPALTANFGAQPAVPPVSGAPLGPALTALGAPPRSATPPPRTQTTSPPPLPPRAPAVPPATPGPAAPPGAGAPQWTPSASPPAPGAPSVNPQVPSRAAPPPPLSSGLELASEPQTPARRDDSAADLEFDL